MTDKIECPPLTGVMLMSVLMHREHLIEAGVLPPESRRQFISGLTTRQYYNRRLMILGGDVSLFEQSSDEELIAETERLQAQMQDEFKEEFDKHHKELEMSIVELTREEIRAVLIHLMQGYAKQLVAAATAALPHEMDRPTINIRRYADLISETSKWIRDVETESIASINSLLNNGVVIEDDFPDGILDPNLVIIRRLREFAKEKGKGTQHAPE